MYLYINNYADGAVVGFPLSVVVDSSEGIATDLTIDWGDGTAVDTFHADYGYNTFTHTYAVPGIYTVTGTKTNINGTASASSDVTLLAEAVNARPGGAIDLTDEGSLTFTLAGAPFTLDLPNPFTGPSSVNVTGSTGLVYNYSRTRLKWFRWRAPRDGMLNVRLTSGPPSDADVEGMIANADLVILNQLYDRFYNPSSGIAGVPVRQDETYLFWMGVNSYFAAEQATIEWFYQRRKVVGRCMYIGTGFASGAAIYNLGLTSKTSEVGAWRSSVSDYSERLTSDGARVVYSPISQDYGLYSDYDYPTPGPKGLLKVVNGRQVAPVPSVWSFPSPVVSPWVGDNLEWDQETKRFVCIDRDGVLLPASILTADTNDRDRTIVAFDDSGLLDYWTFAQNDTPLHPWPPGTSVYTQHFLQNGRGMYARGQYFWCADLVRPNTSNGARDIVRYRLDDDHVATEVFRFTPTYTNLDSNEQGFLYFSVNRAETKMVVSYKRAALDTGPGNPYGLNGWYTGGMWVQVYDLTTTVPTKWTEFQFLPYPVIPNSYNSVDNYRDYSFYGYGVMEFDPDDDSFIWMLNNGTKQASELNTHHTFAFRLPLYTDAVTREAAMSPPFAQFQMDLAEETYFFAFGSLGAEPDGRVGPALANVSFHPRPTGSLQ